MNHAHREEIRLTRTQAILALRTKGHEVLELTPYQFRINGTIDLYPMRRRYHHLPTNTRGPYGDPLTIVEQLGGMWRLSEQASRTVV